MSYFQNPQLFNNFNSYKFNVPPKNISEFSIMEQLGKGAHGSVHRVQHKKNGKIYALKSINQDFFKNKESDPKRKENMDYVIKGREIDYLREKTILYDLTNRNYSHVIKLYADFEDNQSRYLVMELAQGKKLENLKDEIPNNGYLSENLIINILTQLLEILKYLHDTVHIIHRDIKPDNIILDQNNQIKLLDFGLAVYLVNNKSQLVSNRSIKGALRYVPPEILFPSKPPEYDYKVDIFSLGFTMYSLMNPSNTNKPNLPQDTKNEYGNIERTDNVLVNSFYKTWLIEFVQTLYSKDPANRPTAEGALNFLKEFQVNPNLNLLYNNLKKEKNNKTNVENLNFILRRDSGIPKNMAIMNNINNNIFNNIPMANNMNDSVKQIMPYNNMNQVINKNVTRSNSQSIPQLTSIEEFLQPNMGTDNKILTSLKSIFRIYYRLDIMKFIEAQLQSIFSNSKNNIMDLFIYKFYEMLEATKKYENNLMNKINYEQMLTNFKRILFIKNSSGISGIRPIIILYMISSVFKDEFQQYFNDIYENNIFDSIIQTNYFSFNCILPINNPIVYQTISNIILNFKNRYKGPFVDNFCFILLYLSRCPQCNNLFGISKSHIGHFLQLDVPYYKSNLINIINDYFSRKIKDGNYKCSNCGTQGKKASQIVCLNLPEYLFLEFEDKNIVLFSDIICIPLYNGQLQNYQYVASIYKKTVNSIVSFVSMIKTGNSYVFCSDESVQQCFPTMANSENPSLALYKKVLN